MFTCNSSGVRYWLTGTRTVATGCNEPSTVAAVHDALCGSTAITTRSSDFLVTENGTNLSLPRNNWKRGEGTPTFANAGLSSATPRRGGGDRAGRPVSSQPAGDS